MDALVGLSLAGNAALPSGLALTAAQRLSVLLGTVAALAAVGVRYRYSTAHATYYLTTVVLLALSPLSVGVLSVRPGYFLGGFLVVQAGSLLADSVYTGVTGETTGVAAFRTVAAGWFDRLRDRRRSVRRRLEGILDRKTVIAVLVGMPLSEFVKVTVVQLFAAEPVKWRLAWAHLVLVLFGLAVGVHWERIKDAARDAGEQAEAVVEDG